MRTSVGILLLAACWTLRATSLFSQSPPNSNATDFTSFRVADDFTLSSAATLDEIDFWYAAAFQTDLASVTYAIYNDASGALGSMLYTGTVTPTTAPDVPDDTFFATIALPNLMLSAGTYWLELHDGSSLTDTDFGIDTFWDNVDDNASYNALLSPMATPGDPPSVPVTFSGSEQQAFQIDGTAAPVPEPSTFLLVGCAAVFAIRRATVRFRVC